MERIGVEFTTNEGQQVIVIDYINNKQVQVMFLDEHKWTTWVTWKHLKDGYVKNPFLKSVCGVGYLGVMKNGERPKTSGEKLRCYNVWKGMIERCYSGRYETYENVTVCERWHNYSLFLEDLPLIKNYEYWRDNPKKGISLDKDFYYSNLGINTDSKEYSLVTTRFIDGADNIKEMAERTQSKRIRCIETGQVFDSLAQAENETGVPYQGISQCCRGKTKTCGKLHWEYVE